MRIQGVESLRYTKPFVFQTVKKSDGSPLTIQITALPYMWDREVIREIGTRPAAPIRKVGESDGKPIWKTCEDDPEYQRALSEQSAMLVTAMVFFSISGDPTIQWETPTELRKQKPREYWAAIAQEIHDSGWPAVDVSRLIAECQELSESTPEAPKSDFLSTDS